MVSDRESAGTALIRAAAAGAAGAVTTTVLHELTRHLVPDAPRVDLLGMQGMARLVPLRGQPLFAATLGADLVSNTVYYAAVGSAQRKLALPLGVLLGAAAGIGAVVLPGPLGLSPEPTNRSTTTQLLAAALYLAGGTAAGLVYRALD